MSATRKIKKGIEVRSMTPIEVMELQEMQRLVNGRKFEAAQVKGNTALVPDGQKLAEQLEAVVRLLENVKNQWVSAKLVECGYPQDAICDINLSTGEIKLKPKVDGPENSK